MNVYNKLKIAEKEVELLKKGMGKYVPLTFIVEYIASNINSFVEFENELNTDSGVYFIEDYYIGKSKNIVKRIAQHLADTLKKKNSWNIKNLNIKKIECLIATLKVKKLKVLILDSDMDKENDYINMHYLTSPLTNKQGVTKENKEAKIAEVKTLFYAVRKGRKCGLTMDLLEFNAQIDGFPNAEYKIFDDRKNAESYLRQKPTKKEFKNNYKGSKLDVIKAKRNFY